MSYRTDLIAQSRVFRTLSRFHPASQFDWFDIWRGHLADTLIRLLEALGCLLFLIYLVPIGSESRPSIETVTPTWRPPLGRTAGRQPAAP